MQGSATASTEQSTSSSRHVPAFGKKRAGEHTIENSRKRARKADASADAKSIPQEYNFSSGLTASDEHTIIVEVDGSSQRFNRQTMFENIVTIREKLEKYSRFYSAQWSDDKTADFLFIELYLHAPTTKFFAGQKVTKVSYPEGFPRDPNGLSRLAVIAEHLRVPYLEMSLMRELLTCYTNNGIRRAFVSPATVAHVYRKTTTGMKNKTNNQSVLRRFLVDIYVLMGHAWLTMSYEPLGKFIKEFVVDCADRSEQDRSEMREKYGLDSGNNDQGCDGKASDTQGGTRSGRQDRAATSFVVNLDTYFETQGSG